MHVSGAWIIGTTETQVLGITMSITYSTPLSRRNDAPGIHKTLKVVWEQAKFDAKIREGLREESSNNCRTIVTGMLKCFLR